MPKKKHFITDEERTKRLKQAATEFETSNDPKAFDRAFAKVVKPHKIISAKRPS
jgi:hypothetical protein